MADSLDLSNNLRIIDREVSNIWHGRYVTGPRPAEITESFVCRDNPDLARVELTSKFLPLKSLNLVISSEKKNIAFSKKESLGMINNH